MKKLVMAAALLLCAAAPAAAQQEPSPGEMQAVREFIEVTRMRDTFTRTVEMMLEAATKDEELPDGFRDVMREFMAEHFSYEILEPGFIQVYTDLFTEAELRELTAFHRTPAGQRYVELAPEMAMRTEQFTSEIMEEAMPALMRRIAELAEEEEKASRAPVRRKS